MNSTNPINPLTQLPITDGELRGAIELANHQLALESDIATLEALLKRKQEELMKIQMFQLPEAMSAVGIESLTLTGLTKVIVEPFYSCSLSDEYPELKTQGLKWLRCNNAGQLIKHEVKVALGVDAVKELASLRGFLNRRSMPFKDGQTVHNATLKSFMKEQLQAGKPFPLDIFRGFSGKKAKITVGK